MALDLVWQFDPTPPWHWIVIAFAAVMSIALLARGFADGWRILSGVPLKRVAILLFSLITALCLALASLNPTFVAQVRPETLHLVVVLDVSDSILRSQGGWPSVRTHVADWLEARIANVDDETKQQATASIVTFRDGTNIFSTNNIADLPTEIRQLEEGDFAAGSGSNLAAGLQRAATLIEGQGGRGSILLVTDGSQTAGDAEAIGVQLAQRGIAIHILPLDGRGPDLVLESADLPRHLVAQTPTYLRGIFRNLGTEPVAATLDFYKNAINAEMAAQIAGRPPQLPGEFDVEPGAWGTLRHKITFDGVGLQYGDLFMQLADGQGEVRRRFYTHVSDPLRIVAIGDQRWTAALPQDVAEITVIPNAQDFDAATHLDKVDAVVIAESFASEFAEGQLTALAAAVGEKGVGLMLINGAHNGLDVEQPTMLMSYNGSDLEAILPVSSRPRPFTPEPPGRSLVILVDGSGSMEGWPMAKAKEISRFLVESYLRPIDRLDLLVFTTTALHLVQDLPMDDAGKQFALTQINAMPIGGGTDPNEALTQIASRKLTNCGLVFISDLEFEQVNSPPECAATVFAIGYTDVIANSPLVAYADPFPVNEGFNPGDITIPYFEPKPRDKFYELGDFTPLPINFDRVRLNLPVNINTPLMLPGNAVTYIREDADLIAIRPKLIDPVLAYRGHGAGYVGVFTSEIAEQWTGTDEALKVVEGWITRLVPYIARDRYDFHLRDRGTAIEIEIAIAPKMGQIPAVNELIASLEMADGVQVAIFLTGEPNVRGLFTGLIRVPRSNVTQATTLVLEERGGSALPRPQRIPFLLPPATAVGGVIQAEQYSFGRNEALLRLLTESSGGIYDGADNFPLLADSLPHPPGIVLWPWLAAMGAVAYLAAIALRRFER